MYIKAEKRYVSIVTDGKNYSSAISIGQMEKLLPNDLFCRIHRSFIISLTHTDAFDHELAYVGNKKIPIAEPYFNILRNAIIVIHGLLAEVGVDDLLSRVSS